MLRVPAPGRIEDRTVDGSCNPYLAATAMLAAGLDGIERGLDAGDPNAANLYTMSDAEREAAGHRAAARATCSTRRASSSAATCCAPGSARPRDGDYLDYFVEVKRREVAGRPRADHAVGARPLPAAVLMG